MKLSHRPAAVSSAFDDPNLVSAAGLVPTMGLAWSTGLGALVDEHLHLPDYSGANAGLKISALVAGMLAGAGCIEDMGICGTVAWGNCSRARTLPPPWGRSCANSRSGTYASSTRQRCGGWSSWPRAAPITAGIDELALVDIDDTIKATYGYQKQGAGYGYSGVKGLNALIGTVTTNATAPVIAGARLRKGTAISARGAAKFVADLLAAVARLRSPDAGGMVLLRADSAYYAHSVAAAAPVPGRGFR